MPPLRDVLPSRKPDPWGVLRPYDQVAQRAGPSRLADKPGMKSDRAHPWMSRPFLPEVFDAAFAVLEKLAGVRITRREREPSIVVGVCVGNDEVLFPLH